MALESLIDRSLHKPLPHIQRKGSFPFFLDFLFQGLMPSYISCWMEIYSDMIHDQSRSGSNPEPVKRSFKGVVPQQSGHWGAQIYANHHRIWLGTFKSEVDAAMAYDSAALNLRNEDSHRNFPASNDTLLETTFQSRFTTEVVLAMIRDGSYPSKLDDFLRNHVQPEMDLNGLLCAFLFQKELTPSDVGKLNRLVIPKRYAVKHFPIVPETSETEEVQLEFYDREMRVWKFRYCYWRSSQSFVFTKGWNGFVKDKGLRASDTIAFYACQKRCGTSESFLVIDTKTEELDVDKVEDGTSQDHTGEILDSAPPPPGKGFRLFGVQIDG